MKIFYVKGDYDFCYYYRGYLPGVYSGQMTMPYNSEPNVDQLLEADVVVFQRPSDKKYLDLAKLLKRAGKKIIFENDDTYAINRGIMLDRLENDRQREVAIGLSLNLTQFLGLADGVIASTPILAKEYAEVNSNVCVLKNCIDPDDAFPCAENTTGKFRVGFIGSVSTNDDYIHIKEEIRKMDDAGITIVVLGVKYKDGKILSFMQEDYEFWNSLKNIEWHPYCHVSEYMMTLADLALDLAIIPRKDNYFNRCKSNLKFLEMALLKIPTLAQGFISGDSPYQGEDEKYLTIVINNSDWYNKVIGIKNNYSKYKAQAEKAHEYVLENYNIQKYATRWTKAIKKLCKI